VLLFWSSGQDRWSKVTWHYSESTLILVFTPTVALIRHARWGDE
jgi:hypothetical protein